MANITFDRDWIDAADRSTGAFAGLVRRFRAPVRLSRIDSGRGAAEQLVHAESHDPRMLADVGIDARKHRRYDWIDTMNRAMGGRSH